MPTPRAMRKRQLEQMTRAAIVTAWRNATKSADKTASMTVQRMIDQTLEAEFPTDGRNPSTNKSAKS
jgi:hypothetical protein